MRDPYINENGVLRNKLNITDYEELNKAEADIGFLQLINIDSIKMDDCDPKDAFKKLHKHIFKDIFDWAGEYRTCPLVKEEFIFPGYSVPYSPPRQIAKDLKKEILELELIDWTDLQPEERSMVFARRIALLWKVHPFRDGNTRTTLSYACVFAKEHGFPMDMRTFTDNLQRLYYEDGMVRRHNIRDKFVLASLEEENYPEVGPLASIFTRAMHNYKEPSGGSFHK